MITCPWCGTSYVEFRSNCRNCGGTIELPRSDSPAGADEVRIPVPPLPPRPVARSYVWRLLWTDGWAITAFVFALLGILFAPLGAILAIFLITIFVGLPFLGLGLLFLGAGIGLLAWRYQAAGRTLRVLQNGQATRGEIVSVEVNSAVQVNGRNPWTIAYRFQAGGAEHQGRVTTLNPPGPQLQAGWPACVLYLPEKPEYNALFPHP
ncbi:MAG: hypothetical protein JXB85_11740 [Anaerolineales bacterium]|nr:hypothetical protein [Anaerolineales bacterium]